MRRIKRSIIKKGKISLKILIICAVIFVVMPLSYAVFKSITGSDGHLVSATWSVTLNQAEEDNYLSIIPGESTSDASYTINITSASDVDIIYSIVLEELPAGVKVSLDGGTFVEEVNNRIIFADVGTIAYNAQNKTSSHILTFEALSGANYVTEQEVNVDVIARQAL